MRDIPSMHQILWTFLPHQLISSKSSIVSTQFCHYCIEEVKKCLEKKTVIKYFKSQGEHLLRKFQNIWQDDETDVSSSMFSLKICRGPTSHLKGRYLTPQALTNRVLILLKADMISRRMQHFPFVLSVIVDICQQWEEVQVNLQWRA